MLAAVHPLGGPTLGVDEWGTTSPTWIPFVRVLDRNEAGLRVYEDRHGDLLRDRANRLELVVVTVKRHLGLCCSPSTWPTSTSS